MSINLINTLAQPLKTAAKFVNHNEQASGLSTARFIQDTTTCLGPKAVFARSKADLAENAFLEIAESCLVYLGPAFIGEKFSRRFFSKKLSQEAKKLVATPAVKLLEENNAALNKVLPVKAAIALSALLIPLTEFTLNYFKNLMTLNIFHKSDFNNIVSLQNEKEDKSFQDKVRKSAHKNILKAGVIFLTSLAAGVVLAKKGEKSKLLQQFSEMILVPGTKFFKKNQKMKNFFNKYFSLDFASQDGELVLSKGQLTSCVLIGGAGYFGASKDRGKQNFLETLFRFPLVGFYIITGSEPYENAFKKLLIKLGKCKQIIDKNLEVPSFAKIEELAKNLALKNGTTVENEFKKLAKQKVLISGFPFLFSIGFMGFFVAGVSNVFTRYRYDKDKEQQAQNNNFIAKKNYTPTFKQFIA